MSFQGSWITSLTAAVMGTSVWNLAAACAMKAGLERTAQSPTAPWAVPAGACAWKASASVTMTTVGMTAQRSAVQWTAVPEGFAWMGSVSVRKVTPGKTVAN